MSPTVKHYFFVILIILIPSLGMDDTHVDLIFDEGGRSVPTTPRSRTPPSISVTDLSKTEAFISHPEHVATVSISPVSATTSKYDIR